MAESICSVLSGELYQGEKLFSVILTKNTLSWCPAAVSHRKTRAAAHKQTLSLTEVLVAVPCEDEPIKPNGDIELMPYNTTSGTVFYIHTIEKLIKSHKWKEKKIVFDCRDAVVCQRWVEKINDILNGFDRPRKLLVFINPVGGKKLGPKIYVEKVQPLFEVANVKTEVIVTKRANHARDYLEDTRLEKIDGVISVGGDGMFHEVLNGVIIRTQKEQAVAARATDFEPLPPKIKVGIIPAGSTDTISYCTTGNNDPVTSALHIILGCTHPLDVCSVRHRNEVLSYSVAMQAYGFFGDVMKDSEKLRWMGPRRYDCSGTKKFLTNRGYEGTVMFREAQETDTGPRDNNRCRTGCFVCRKDHHLNSHHRHSSNLQTGHGWKTISGRFTSIIGANISCVCAKSPEGLSPSAHLADGCLDLVLVRHTSRLQHLRHMIRLARRASDQFDFSFVEVYRVKEYRFRPLPHIDQHEEGSEDQSTGFEMLHESEASPPNTPTDSRPRARSLWNVDGELVEQAEIHVKSHRQLVKLYARGIEECEETPSCTICRRKR